jgi:hypothetical protein
MFVIVILIATSDPKTTSDFSALIARENFGVSETSCAVSTFKNAPGTKNANIITFVKFVIVPRKLRQEKTPPRRLLRL